MPRSDTQIEVYEARLAVLVELLSREPWTASALSRSLRCPKSTLYHWLRILQARGFKLVEEKRASGGFGPWVTVYSMKKERS